MTDINKLEELAKEIRRRYPTWFDGTDPLVNLPMLPRQNDGCIAAQMVEISASLISKCRRMEEALRAGPPHDGKDWLLDEDAVEAATTSTGISEGVIRAAVRAYYDQIHDADKAALQALQDE